MSKPAVLFLSGMAVLLQSTTLLADNNTFSQQVFSIPQAKKGGDGPASPSQKQPVTQGEAPKQAASFSAFTGKVTKNKVRLRIQPSLESPILKELSPNDMLIVVGETEDFYAVQAPTGIKAYVFRTFVLDNVVEASKVNVRLEPDLEAPVIAQMHSGDRVEGIISPLNNKWLEIAPPASARFYVSKDYIENIGTPSVMAKLEKRRDDVNILLNSTYLSAQKEMQKPFPEITLEGVYTSLNKVINDYRDYPEQVARAKELLISTQDNYLQKKIVFLESKTKTVQDDWESKSNQLNEQVKSQQQKMSQMEQMLKKNSGTVAQDSKSSQDQLPYGMSNKMAAWLPAEASLYTAWQQSNPDRSQTEFYHEQSSQSVALKGILEPYNRVIKNKPGDYLLVNQTTHLPVAYLYSTQVNLQDRVGHEVTVYGSPRDNRNFAFPAYFVLSVE
ncbi:MAG: SH3 domain-containing protein [Parachlamydiaceae bacterium]